MNGGKKCSDGSFSPQFSLIIPHFYLENRYFPGQKRSHDPSLHFFALIFMFLTRSLNYIRFLDVVFVQRFCFPNQLSKHVANSA